MMVVKLFNAERHAIRHVSNGERHEWHQVDSFEAESKLAMSKSWIFATLHSNLWGNTEERIFVDTLDTGNSRFGSMVALL